MGHGHGVASSDAEHYVRSLFQGVGRSLSDENRSLHQLAADHETPNGNNERIRTTWFDTANSEALNNALDDLLADLKAWRTSRAGAVCERASRSSSARSPPRHLQSHSRSRHPTHTTTIQATHRVYAIDGTLAKCLVADDVHVKLGGHGFVDRDQELLVLHRSVPAANDNRSAQPSRSVPSPA
jgi:hypothetical protein